MKMRMIPAITKRSLRSMKGMGMISGPSVWNASFGRVVKYDSQFIILSRGTCTALVGSLKVHVAQTLSRHFGKEHPIPKLFARLKKERETFQSEGGRREKSGDEQP